MSVGELRKLEKKRIQEQLEEEKRERYYRENPQARPDIPIDSRISQLDSGPLRIGDIIYDNYDPDEVYMVEFFGNKETQYSNYYEEHTALQIKNYFLKKGIIKEGSDKNMGIKRFDEKWYDSNDWGHDD